MTKNAKKAIKISKAKKTRRPMDSHLNHRVREGILIITSALALFMLLALISYHRADWASSSLATHVVNLGGRAGAVISWGFFSTFGYAAFIFPLMMAYAAWLYMRNNGGREFVDWKGFLLKFSGFIFILAAGCGIASLQFNIFHLSIPYGRAAGSEGKLDFY